MSDETRPKRVRAVARRSEELPPEAAAVEPEPAPSATPEAGAPRRHAGRPVGCLVCEGIGEEASGEGEERLCRKMSVSPGGTTGISDPRVANESIYRWIDSKGFPAHRVGRLLRLKLSELDEWVQGRGGDDSGSPVPTEEAGPKAPRRESPIKRRKGIAHKEEEEVARWHDWKT